MTPHVLIVGAGVAGLSAARTAAAAGADVTVIVPGQSLAECGGNTQRAQGGIAAALGAEDQPSRHAADTLGAGVGLADAAAVALLVSRGADEMRRVLDRGFEVDRQQDGRLTLGLEGAHSRPRIVHSGEDRTGAALHAFLLKDLRPDSITVRTGLTLEGLLVEHGAVRGVRVRTTFGDEQTLTSDAVVLANGGYAGMFPRSTNAAGATGSGLLSAARAGALLADLEFVQFHPTVLMGTGILISEAVRGAGAVLRDAAGQRFMRDAHPKAELASRDVVSREIHRILHDRGEAEVWLDATPIEREDPGSLAARFPAITAALAARGFDWAREPVPVAPAAHYSMGGVATDTEGRTSVPGLFAAGEVAATGVHGANRLASNSLLEGLVFGARSGGAASRFARSGWHSWSTVTAESDPLIGRTPRTCHLDVPLEGSNPDLLDRSTQPSRHHSDPGRADLDRAIETGLGIVRHADCIRESSRTFSAAASDPRLRDTAQLALLITAAADARTESRGAHLRSDYPETDPEQAVRRTVRAVAATSTHRPSGPPVLAGRAATHVKEIQPC